MPSSMAACVKSAGRRRFACGTLSGLRCRQGGGRLRRGYKKRFTLVSSALELTGLELVPLFAARFRQEDGFRDLKQRLG